MNTYQPTYTQTANPYGGYQQIQQIFPQPQGSVYTINAIADIGNVPIGSTGLSVAICFSEQLLYIKSFQNGNPVIMAYRILPYAKEEPSITQSSTNVAASQPKDGMEQRLEKMEQLIKNLVENNGGKFDGLL